MNVRELVAILRFDGRRAMADARKFEGVVRGVRATLLSLAGPLAAAFSIQKIGETLDTVTSLEARIAQLPQTVGSAADAFDTVAKRAAAARQGVEPYANLYIRLAGATKTFVTRQEDVLAITDTISKALVVGGAKAQEQAAAILQISQAFQKGKLDGDEFRTFMETMSTDLKDKLAKRLGTTTDQLYAWSQAGKITVKGLASAFIDMREEIDEQFKRMPITINQAMVMIFDRMTLRFAKFNRETNFVRNTSEALLRVWDRFEPVVIKVAVGIDRLVKSLGGWKQVLGEIAIAFGIFVAIMSPIATVIAAAIGAIILAVEDVEAYFNGENSVTGLIVRKFQEAEAWLTGWGDRIRAFFAKIVEDIKGFFGSIGHFFGGIPEALGIGGGSPSIPGQPAEHVRRAPGRGSGALTINHTGKTEINVPAGTTSEQAASIDRQVKKSFDEQFGRILREASGNEPQYQGGW